MQLLGNFIAFRVFAGNARCLAALTRELACLKTTPAF
jgi:hypothetical protein